MSDKTTLLNPQNLAVAGSFTAGTGAGLLTTSGGSLAFGVVTTSAGKVFSSNDGISGYITILDTSGVSRKIAILT